MTKLAISVGKVLSVNFIVAP